MFGKKVLIVDTPGLFDTETPNERMILKIIQCILIISPGPHAILLTIKIDRLTQQVKDTIAIFKRYFGEKANTYMIVIFTHKDKLTTRRGTKSIETFISEIKEDDMIKGLLRQCDMRYVAFDNTVDPKSAVNEKQVKDLLDMIQEMVRNNGGSHYSNEMLKEAERIMKEKEAQLGSRYAAREQTASPSWTDVLLTVLPPLIKAFGEITSAYMMADTRVNLVHSTSGPVDMPHYPNYIFSNLFRNMRVSDRGFAIDSQSLLSSMHAISKP